MVFHVGDNVRWESQSRSNRTTKRGVVIAIVPAGERPTLPEGYRCNSSCGYGLPRNERSYLVAVGNSKRCYWPRVKNLLLENNA